MKTHVLKIWPSYFQLVVTGQKTFEVRKNDRNFKVGDELLLREWNGQYTGSFITFRIVYILHGGEFGIESGYCVMSIKPIP